MAVKATWNPLRTQSIVLAFSRIGSNFPLKNFMLFIAGYIGAIFYQLLLLQSRLYPKIKCCKKYITFFFILILSATVILKKSLRKDWLLDVCQCYFKLDPSGFLAGVCWGFFGKGLFIYFIIYYEVWVFCVCLVVCLFVLFCRFFWFLWGNFCSFCKYDFSSNSRGWGMEVAGAALSSCCLSALVLAHRRSGVLIGRSSLFTKCSYG